GTVVGQIFEVKDFAHAYAYHGNHDPVPGLSAIVGFVGAHFTTPGIGADGCDLFVVYPVGSFKGQARCFPSGVAAPIALTLAALHMASADDDKVAPTYFDALRLRSRVQISAGNGLAIFKRVDADVSCDIEKDAAPDHLGLDLFDSVLVSPVAVDKTRVVAVPHFFAVKNVTQAIPLRAALQGHGDSVVCVTQAPGVLIACHGICACGQHGMDGVVPVAP